MRDRRPSGTLGNSRTRVLLAVQARRFPTVTSVAIDTGLSRANVYRHLGHLYDDGLVDWDQYGGRAGTLRPLLRPVPVV